MPDTFQTIQGHIYIGMKHMTVDEMETFLEGLANYLGTNFPINSVEVGDGFIAWDKDGNEVLNTS